MMCIAHSILLGDVIAMHVPCYLLLCAHPGASPPSPLLLLLPQQDLGHWRGILRSLHCRPEQLRRKIAAGHLRYVTRMAPVLQERKGKH
jgi:hypothetical protein